MKELIPVRQQSIGQQEIKTVNARELHSFLEVKKDFSDWIKDRINKYGFTENQDYVCSPVLGSEGRGGKNRIDYHLTIDMAKELSMVERNEKGKEARLYFLECERVANQPQNTVALPNFLDPAAAAIAWAEQYTLRITAEKTKAQIGARREATAMNTASQAVKKANALEAQLDISKEYASVKRMTALYHGIEFNWRELKSASAIMGIPPLDIFDANYGSVKSYHRHVWIAVYALDVDGNPASAEVQAEANSTIRVCQSELN